MNKNYIFKQLRRDNLQDMKTEEPFVEEIFYEIDKENFASTSLASSDDQDADLPKVTEEQESPIAPSQEKSSDFNEGYEIGKKEAIATLKAELAKKEKEFQQQTNDHLSTLLQNLKKSIDNLCKNKKCDLEQKKHSLFNLSVTIGEKLATQSLNANAVAVVEKFLADIFDNLQDDGVINIKVNNSVRTEIEDIIMRWDFPNKIVIHTDNTIAKSDCTVTWQTGSAESILQSRFDNVHALLSSYINDESKE